MRIGFFTDSYFPGVDGVTYTVRAWRERLESDGHDVYVIYPASSYEPGDREIPVGSLPNPLYRQYPIPLYGRVSALPAFDIVHCHGPAATGLMGRRYADTRDVPAVYTHHTPIEEYFAGGLGSERLAAVLGRLYVAYENRLLRSFDCVTASTPRIRRRVDPRTLPVGVELDTFRPQAGGPFGADAPVVGYSGRITENKNVDELLRLAERMPDTRFHLVGEGPARGSLERAAPDNVAFHDFVPRERLPAVYSTFDVFVTASTCDTLGLSSLEANACGTPVAAAAVPPFEETIGPDNGALFEYRNVADMRRAVIDCLEGDRPTRRAVERFGIAETIAELKTVYDRLLAAEDPPRGSLRR